MSNLWCTELLDESPSTSRHSLGTYGSNNPSSSGWVSAERRRLHGMSLMDNSSTVHHPSRPLQNSASFRRVQTGVLAQSRRSLEFSIDNRNSNENRPSQYYNMSASTNDVTNSGTWRKNSTRVLTSIDTNARTFNAAQPVYQADSSSSGISHSLSLQRSAARKRRLTADHQLNVAQRLWVASDVDKTVHLDSRTLTALLRAEQYTLPNADHYKSLQREINENVRRSAVVFISDICNRENADLVVLPLAVSYIDRVLSVQFVPRHNLLALANACLLLASKMKAPRPLTPQQIVEHTDNWVTQDELLDWELFIVNKLGWQLSTATAYEFFDQLMVRAPILETLRESFAQTLAAMLKVFCQFFPEPKPLKVFLFGFSLDRLRKGLCWFVWGAPRLGNSHKPCRSPMAVADLPLSLQVETAQLDTVATFPVLHTKTNKSLFFRNTFLFPANFMITRGSRV